MTDTINLKYHQGEHPARRCGKLAKLDVFFLVMQTTSAIVKQASGLRA
jgi:hypothetical protein